MKKAIAIILSIMLIMAITLPAAALKSIAVKSIKLNSSKITLKVGQTYNLKATLTPANTTQKLLTYVTGNKKIATVSTSGKITGVSKGTTTITVVSSSNKKILAKCNVTISQLEQKEVKLTYVTWMSKGEDKPTLDSFMKENPNIKIEEQVLDGIEYDKLLRTRIMAGDAPDIILNSNINYFSYVKDGFFMDLTNEPGMKLVNTSESVSKSLEVDGKKYGFPFSSGNAILPVFYNKNYFNKLGFTPPKTLKEFDALCTRIKADNKDVLIVGGKDNWTVGIFPIAYNNTLTLAKYRGKQFDIKLKAGEIKLADEWKFGLEWWADIIKKGYVAKESMTMTYPQSVQYFADGKAALLYMGSWIPEEAAIKNAKDMDLGSFMMPLPVSDGKVYTSGSLDRIVSVSATTKNPEAARKYFNYCAQPDVAKAYIEACGLSSLMAIEYKTNPALDDFYKATKAPNVIVDFGGQTSMIPVAISITMNEAAVNLMVGSTVEAELKKVESAFEKAKPSMKVD